MHVALLAPCFWPETRRGAERFVRDLADGLLEHGHRPSLITSHPRRVGRVVEDRLPVTRVWRPPHRWLERREYEWYLTHWPLSEAVLRRSHADLANAVFATDALAAVRWRRSTGRPVVFSYMGIPDHEGLVCRRWRLTITRRVVAGASATVALSRVAAEAFWRELGVEARVIHPGVDLRSFSPGGERAPEPTIFCAAAVGEPRKRVGLLVRAFDLVRRRRPGARLVLSRPADPREAANLRRPGVELADVDDRAALADAYRSAWVSALPSTNEAFGLVLVESLACGTPVVASDRDGMREIVDRPEVGRLFEGDDEGSLARSLLEALELSEAPGTPGHCRSRAEDFSTASTTAAYLDLYAELLPRC